MRQAALVIDRHGGDSAVARRLGYKLPSGARRVHNWRIRGIPFSVQLEHPWLRLLPESVAVASAGLCGVAQDGGLPAQGSEAVE